MGDPEIRAIPTLYEGVEYRSRLEADTAMLLDKLKIPHAYEPKSYLLKVGGHYRPDFALWGGEQILEVRGYANAKGNAQIVGMCDEVFEGRHGSVGYFVLRTDDLGRATAATHFGHPHLPDRWASIGSYWAFEACERCGNWNPVPDMKVPCGKCGYWLRPSGRMVVPIIDNGTMCILTNDAPPQSLRVNEVNPLDHIWPA